MVRRECVALVKELGDVEYIILSTHAYEHKLFIAPFSRQFPRAKVRRSNPSVIKFLRIRAIFSYA